VTTYYKKKEIMAINVDKVYKSVLSILNKEQRGYITPDEFNKIAKQTQLSLLEQAFTLYNKELVMQDNGVINEGYADLPSKTKDKIDAFYQTGTLTSFVTGTGTLPTDIYQIIEVSNSNINIEEVDQNRLSFLNSSPLTKPTVDFPIYYKTPTQMVIAPTTITNPTIKYVKVPTAPRWGYTIDATYGSNIYDNRTFVDTGLVTGVGELTSSAILTGLTGTNGSYEFTKAVGSGNGWTNGVGTGIDAKLKVTVATNVFTIDVIDAGSGFAIGDTIKIETTRDTDGSNHMNLNSNLVMTLTAPDIYTSSTTGSTNFELHPSDETNLILGILGYAGVTIKDPGITQLSAAIAQANETVKRQ